MTVNWGVRWLLRVAEGSRGGQGVKVWGFEPREGPSRCSALIPRSSEKRETAAKTTDETETEAGSARYPANFPETKHA